MIFGRLADAHGSEDADGVQPAAPAVEEPRA
jgi:hypothetical protein